MVCLQTDDTAYVCDAAFIQLEKEKKRSLESKDSVLLMDVNKLELNGGMVQLS